LTRIAGICCLTCCEFDQQKRVEEPKVLQNFIVDGTLCFHLLINKCDPNQPTPNNKTWNME
jgi:hypothetical protein